MPTNASFPIVGIGASAGGLRALEDFFKTIQPRPGMAFVIVTHLAPDRESFLTDILARHTKLPVHVASDGLKVEHNAVYVLPPNASMTIAEGRLRLRQTEPGQHDRNPIDVFFSSLSEDCGEYSVGIVLSGSGHDGVLGVKAIKEQGGLVLAQSSGSSGPGFADMPDSAIASGLVDFAVPVDAMAPLLEENARGLPQLDRLAGSPPLGAGDRAENDHAENDHAESDQADRDQREQLYAILRSQTGHDFSGYKTRTFLRRVQRRMHIHHCEALADTWSFYSGNPTRLRRCFVTF